MKTENIEVESKEEMTFLDITDKINSIVDNLKVKEGFIHLYCMHTTAGLWLNELENGLLEDMKCFLDKVLPSECYYKHDDLKIRTQNLHENERKNGWSHARSTFFNNCLTLPVEDFKLKLGQWQRLLFVDLDGPQKRKLFLQAFDSIN